MTQHALGRRVPTDWRHVERFPLTAATAPAVPTPVVIGVNWYTDFDSPFKSSNGHYYIGRQPKNLGTLRGGHCVCLKPRRVGEPAEWQAFYDQGREGACVGFGASRAMSLLNRKRYFARWLWDRAKATDEWTETNPGDENGTSVRAAMEILRLEGHVPYVAKTMNPLQTDWVNRDKLKGTALDGIQAYRWITSIDDCLAALGYSGLDYVDVLNSWGESYPHLVRMPVDVLDRLWREDGEIAIPTDR